MGPTLSLPGHRQLLLLLSDADDQRYYNDFTGTGNALELRHPNALQHGDRLARATGCRSEGRRFPLRPRDHARAGRGAVRPARKLSRCGGSGPGARLGQADRGAVGHRPRRLSGRRLPARLDRVERPVPRHHAQVLEGRRGPACRRSPSASRARPTSTTTGAPAMGERQLRHRARRVHAARPRQLQPEAQRGEPREQPGRQRRQQQLELRREGATDDPAIRRYACGRCATS